MPDGKATQGASSRWPSISFDRVPGRVVEAAILVEAGRDRPAGGRSRPWSAARARVALVELGAAQMGKVAAARDCAVSVMSFDLFG